MCPARCSTAGHDGAARRAATKAQWRDATITGVLLLCFGNGAVGWAEQRVPSGLAALLVAVVPLWMVHHRLGSAERRSDRAPPCFSAWRSGFAGLVVLVGPSTLIGHGAVDTAAVLVLMGGVAGVGRGIGVQSIRIAARVGRDVDRIANARRKRGVVSARHTARASSAHLHIAQISAASWIGWLYLVTFGSLIGFTAYIFLLKAVTPAKASTYAYVNPLVAVFLGWAIAGESVTVRTLGAAAVILAGVAMISLGSARAPAGAAVRR